MKMSRIATFVFFLIVVSVSNMCENGNDNCPISIGDNIELFSDSFTDENPYLILINSSDFRQAKEVSINGILYVCGVNESGIVEFVLTEDRDFSTPEGVSIGDDFVSLQKQIENIEPITERGFARYITLESGWNACFETTDFDRLKPKPDLDSSWVSFFFKR